MSLSHIVSGASGQAKAVLWDMDGTLLDSEPLGAEMLSYAMSFAGLQPDQKIKDAAVGMCADALYIKLCSECGLSMDQLEWEGLKYRFYVDNLSKVLAFDDALRVWRALNSSGVRQAIVTNADRMFLEANLRHINLSAPGLITVCRNDVKKGKPAPEPYLKAAWLLGVDLSDALVVEDSVGGAAAGVSAGICTLVVPQSRIGIPAGARKLQSYEQIIALTSGVATSNHAAIDDGDDHAAFS